MTPKRGKRAQRQRCIAKLVAQKINGGNELLQAEIILVHLQIQKKVQRLEPAGAGLFLTVLGSVKQTALLQQRYQQANFLRDRLCRSSLRKAREQFRVTQLEDVFRAGADQFRKRFVQSFASLGIFAGAGLFLDPCQHFHEVLDHADDEITLEHVSIPSVENTRLSIPRRQS